MREVIADNANFHVKSSKEAHITHLIIIFNYVLGLLQDKEERQLLKFT